MSAEKDMIGEDRALIQYKTESTMARLLGRVFGGAPSACKDLAKRDWHKLFE